MTEFRFRGWGNQIFCWRNNKPFRFSLPDGVSVKEFIEDFEKWSNQDTLIQNALPYLSDSTREFFISGMTDEDWKKLLPEE